MYSIGLDRLAKRLERENPGGSDPTWEAAYHLALAYAAIRRLKTQGVDLMFENRELIIPSLWRAWRELIHVRSGLPSSSLDLSVITKFGRLVE